MILFGWFIDYFQRGASFLFLWLWLWTSRLVDEVWQCEFKGNSLFCFSGQVVEENIDTIKVTFV